MRGGRRTGCGGRAVPVVAAAVLAGAAGSWPAAAQVATDGTMGPAVTLTGPDVAIPATLGTRTGANLFHSFATFGVPAGGSATFGAPADGAPVSAVVARVTGGGASAIDGRLASEVPGADLYLLNPAGIAFGPGASLDVPGAFHAATADTLHLADGGRFDARDPGASVLTVAPPSAFGFASANPPAALTVDGATLAVGTGRTLSLAGGAVALNGGRVAAPGGTVTVTAADGPVTMGGGAVVSSSGNGGGEVRIVAGSLVVEGAAVRADNTGAADATAGVTIAAGTVTVRDGGQVTAHTGGAGRAGTVAVSADHVAVIGDGRTVNTVVGARALRGSAGDAGTVRVTADVVEVRYGGMFSTSSLDAGNAGRIEVEAGRTVISHDDGAVGSGTGLFSLASAASRGDAGSIVIRGGSLEVLGGAQVSTRTASTGQAGSVDIRVGHLAVSGHSRGDPSLINSQNAPGTSGDSGSITIVADAVEVRDGGRIGSNTRGSGSGGVITITAGRLVMADGVAGLDTGIGSRATIGSTGNGGTVVIRAGHLEIRDGTGITTSTSSTGQAGSITVTAGTLVIDGARAPAGSTPTGITSSVESTAADAGNGGSIVVQADRVRIAAGGRIAATSDGGGTAGDIRITAADRLELRPGGFITTATTRSDGGNVAVDAGHLVHLSQGEVTTSVAGGAGNGGNIALTTPMLVLRDGTIQANAWGGNGGNIAISAENLLSTPDSRIEASSRLGLSGSVTVQAPDGKATANAVPLSTDVTDPATLLPAACAARAAGAPASTLVGGGRGGVGPLPDGPLLASAEPPAAPAAAGGGPVVVACAP